jgi:hypothetical protein
MLDIDTRIRITDYSGAFELMFQLTDIARPLVFHYALHGQWGNCQVFFAGFDFELAQEMIYQERNIFLPALQSRSSITSV